MIGKRITDGEKVKVEAQLLARLRVNCVEIQRFISIDGGLNLNNIKGVCDMAKATIGKGTSTKLSLGARGDGWFRGKDNLFFFYKKHLQ